METNFTFIYISNLCQFNLLWFLVQTLLVCKEREFQIKLITRIYLFKYNHLHYSLKSISCLLVVTLSLWKGVLMNEIMKILRSQTKALLHKGRWLLKQQTTLLYVANTMSAFMNTYRGHFIKFPLIDALFKNFF